jgi:hypothetical protein
MGITAWKLGYEPATPTYQPFQGVDAWVKTLGYFKSLPLGSRSNNRDQSLVNLFENPLAVIVSVKRKFFVSDNQVNFGFFNATMLGDDQNFYRGKLRQCLHALVFPLQPDNHLAHKSCLVHRTSECWRWSSQAWD